MTTRLIAEIRWKNDGTWNERKARVVGFTAEGEPLLLDEHQVRQAQYGSISEVCRIFDETYDLVPPAPPAPGAVWVGELIGIPDTPYAVIAWRNYEGDFDRSDALVVIDTFDDGEPYPIAVADTVYAMPGDVLADHLRSRYEHRMEQRRARQEAEGAPRAA
jgi:hypothetical protein